jgi:hypothetical protein
MYRIFDRKPNRKRQFERCRHRWEKIKRILKKQVEGRGSMEWNHLPQNRDQWQAFVNTGFNSEFNKMRWFLVLHSIPDLMNAVCTPKLYFINILIYFEFF